MIYTFGITCCNTYIFDWYFDFYTTYIQFPL